MKLLRRCWFYFLCGCGIGMAIFQYAEMLGGSSECQRILLAGTIAVFGDCRCQRIADSIAVFGDCR
jgi:hypothetical protein